MRPTVPGTYPLMLLSGRVVMRRVKLINDRPYAMIPGERWYYPAAAVPVESVAGVWLVPMQDRPRA